MTMPTSLRSEAGETAYQTAKLNKDTKPLCDETATRGFLYWRLITNRFPYDAVFAIHDMLIPKRVFPNRSDMTLQERHELDKIIALLESGYDMVFENFAGKRSIANHYHLHLAKYKPRSEMSL